MCPSQHPSFLHKEKLSEFVLWGTKGANNWLAYGSIWTIVRKLKSTTIRRINVTFSAGLINSNHLHWSNSNGPRHDCTCSKHPERWRLHSPQRTVFNRTQHTWWPCGWSGSRGLRQREPAPWLQAQPGGNREALIRRDLDRKVLFCVITGIWCVWLTSTILQQYNRSYLTDLRQELRDRPNHKADALWSCCR